MILCQGAHFIACLVWLTHHKPHLTGDKTDEQKMYFVPAPPAPVWHMGVPHLSPFDISLGSFLLTRLYQDFVGQELYHALRVEEVQA